MSIKIQRPTESLLLELMIQKIEWRGTVRYLKVFEECGRANEFALPMAFALSRGLQPTPCAATRVAWHFEGELRPPQREDFDATLAHLAAMRVSILSLYTGCGKTTITLCLGAFIGLKMLIVVPTGKKVLKPQWLDEIATFIPAARVQSLATKTKVDRSADIFIIGSHTIPKLAAALTFIPLVVVDELHLVLSSEGYKSLLYLQPQYLLGLSATPFRLDGSDRLVELFFGSFQIARELRRDFTVNVLFTPFTYVLEQTEAGSVNWGSVLKQQAEHEARNQLIADIVCQNKGIKFLVLCKRVAQIKDLAQKCREGGVGVQAVYDDIAPIQDARSLVGNIQKIGTGFNDASFEALIVAADAGATEREETKEAAPQSYYIQYLGRILRRPDTCPTVYDIVDKCPIMRKHFAAREKIYKAAGATIKTWSK